MSEQERWQLLTDALSGLRADIAVVKSQINTHKTVHDDHEQRLRQLEIDVTNNKIVVRAAIVVSTAITGTGVTIAASVLKDLIV